MIAIPFGREAVNFWLVWTHASMLDQSSLNVLFDLYMMYNKTYVFAGMDMTSIINISLTFVLCLKNALFDVKIDFEHRKEKYLSWIKRTKWNASSLMEDVTEIEPSTEYIFCSWIVSLRLSIKRTSCGSAAPVKSRCRLRGQPRRKTTESLVGVHWWLLSLNCTNHRCKKYDIQKHSSCLLIHSKPRCTRWDAPRVLWHV